MTNRTGPLVLIAAVLAGCAGEHHTRTNIGPPPEQPPDRNTAPTPQNIPATKEPAPAPGPRWVELSPGLRIDRDRRVLEFDGVVAIDCHNPTTPDVYLELVACSPDTREHESLVVTTVQPSLIHAALLALGYEPGRPGAITTHEGRPTRKAPTGDALSVELVVADRSAPVSAWITDVRARTHHPRGGWVFAGSRFVRRGGARLYDADGAGTVIGLDTFGRETIAFTRVISPDSWVDEPLWIADASAVPARGTPVRVRIGPLLDAVEHDAPRPDTPRDPGP